MLQIVPDFIMHICNITKTVIDNTTVVTLVNAITPIDVVDETVKAISKFKLGNLTINGEPFNFKIPLNAIISFEIYDTSLDKYEIILKGKGDDIKIIL